MATTTIEKDLMGLERQFWQALKDRDSATVMRLTDETCIVTNPEGVGKLSRAQFPEMVENPGYTLRDFKLEDEQVLRVADDVAVVGYKVHEELTVDGKPVSVDAVDASTWVRRDGQWLCALHSEALAGDPFGRDRRAP